MVPGRTVVIVPSSSIAFSELIIPRLVASARCADPDAAARRPYQSSIPNLLAKAGETPPAVVRTRTFGARTRFINSQRAAVKFTTVERAHRSVGLRTIIHCDERKSTRFASHAIHHQMDFVDRSMLFEKILKIVLCGLKREVTYVQFHCVLNLEKLPSYRAVPGNRVSNHQ